MKTFFVYGSLKSKERLHYVFEQLCKFGTYFVTDANIKAKLFDLGAFPAVTEGNDTVYGELIEIEDELDFPHVLKALDEIEGYFPNSDYCLYERKIVDADVSGKEVKAYAYFFSDVEELENYATYLPEGTWSIHRNTSVSTS